MTYSGPFKTYSVDSSDTILMLIQFLVLLEDVCYAIIYKNLLPFKSSAETYCAQATRPKANKKTGSNTTNWNIIIANPVNCSVPLNVLSTLSPE